MSRSIPRNKRKTEPLPFALFTRRRQKALALLTERMLDALVVSSPANIRYLSGFTGSNGLLLLTPGKSWILTDPRYAIQVTQESDCTPKVVRGELPPQLAPLLKLHRWAIGYDSAHMTVKDFDSLAAILPRKSTLKPAPGLVESLRCIKSTDEIAAIRAAVLLNSKAFQNSLKRVKPGLSERDLAAEIDHQMLRLGAEKPAFETIVASGIRTALPHARPTSALLGANALVLVDMGAQAEGYSSDMTRMLFLGRPSAKVKHLHRAVLQAQLAAIDAVGPGVPVATVDKAARGVLKSLHLEQYFVHSTGHGLGLEIHEPPRISQKDQAVLLEGMAITIEPGVYLEGSGGIRIEDTVLVTRTGAEILTPTPKELLVL